MKKERIEIGFLKNINLFSQSRKKIGPSVETERPLRLLDMRIFKCIICKPGNLLKNVLLPALSICPLLFNYFFSKHTLCMNGVQFNLFYILSCQN